MTVREVFSFSIEQQHIRVRGALRADLETSGPWMVPGMIEDSCEILEAISRLDCH